VLIKLRANFLRIKGVKKFNKIQKNLNSNLNQTGHKVLRFKKVKSQKYANVLLELPLFNFNLVQLKTNFFSKSDKITNWVQTENLNFIESHFLSFYQKKLWGSNLKRTAKKFVSNLSLYWHKPTLSLIFSLKFFTKISQSYFLNATACNFNGFTLSSTYWKSFSFFKTPLNNLKLGNYFYKGEYQNFRFSQEPSKGSFLIGSKSSFSLITLPSQKTVWLKKTKTLGILKNDPLKNLKKMKKASSRLLLGKKPSIRGKAMNVFDHPNGGFKHSSKLLKTFKGKNILK